MLASITERISPRWGEGELDNSRALASLPVLLDINRSPYLVGSSPMPPAQHSYARITRRAVAKGLVAALALINTKIQRTSAQEHRRPYFMPPEERRRLLDLILRQPWAKADYARLKKVASTGDGFAGAFLYVLDGDPGDAAIAQQWLLGKYGKKAYW